MKNPTPAMPIHAASRPRSGCADRKHRHQRELMNRKQRERPRQHKLARESVADRRGRHAQGTRIAEPEERFAAGRRADAAIADTTSTPLNCRRHQPCRRPRPPTTTRTTEAVPARRATRRGTPAPLRSANPIPGGGSSGSTRSARPVRAEGRSSARACPRTDMPRGWGCEDRAGRDPARGPSSRFRRERPPSAPVLRIAADWRESISLRPGR